MFRHLYQIALLAGVASVLSFVSVEASAAPSTTPKEKTAASSQKRDSGRFSELSIGVVDMMKVMEGSSAMNAMRGQVETQKKRYQTQFSRQETELMAASKELEALEKKIQDAKTDAEKASHQKVFEEKKTVFETSFKAMQQEAMKVKSSMEQAGQKAMGQIMDQVQKSADQLAQEHDLHLVVPKDTLLYSAWRLDLTGDVVRLLNNALPKVTMDFSVEEDASAAKPTANKSSAVKADKK